MERQAIPVGKAYDINYVELNGIFQLLLRIQQYGLQHRLEMQSINAIHLISDSRVSVNNLVNNNVRYDPLTSHLIRRFLQLARALNDVFAVSINLQWTPRNSNHGIIIADTAAIMQSLANPGIGLRLPLSKAKFKRVMKRRIIKAHRELVFSSIRSTHVMSNDI